MKYADCPGVFVDRHEKESEAEAIDVLMLTLDAESFLDRCLISVYREIPVRRLLVCDGGSKDGTIDILKKYPRVQTFIRPDIRTTGKATEFLFTQLETEWFVLIDADVELPPGWYDEMRKHKAEYDFMESSGRTLAYHFYRDFPLTRDANSRAYDFCFLGRKEAIKKFSCDDDYIWRMIDFYLRQQIEKSGYRYGKVPTAYRIHHETERIPYESDGEKRFFKVVYRFKEPEWIIIDKEKWKRSMQKFAMGAVKYLDPDYPLVRDDARARRPAGFDKVIAMLDRDWVEKNGPAWLKRYDRAASLKARLQRMIISILRPLLKKFKSSILLG
ncbi:MAG: glycosyltransferase family 2 protein [Candidatus Aminicenantes bacterium]|nr:glycosyltransferase family 2 protein [Candidatus Aminicenantes bacterium]